ncbi:MAG: hypothetical protein NVS2B7_27710 [Herpetosiphon sp.]
MQTGHLDLRAHLAKMGLLDRRVQWVLRDRKGTLALLDHKA